MSCSSGVGGTVLNNPSLSMKFHPPVGWTYPPSNAEISMSYFPGQSLTKIQAQNMANGALTAAVLESLNKANIPTVGLEITPSYTPQQVSDCYKNGTNWLANTQFAIVENGAVTKLATASADITSPNCIAHAYATTGTVTYTQFISQATISIKTLAISDYQMNLIAADVMAIL
uniref:Uncharacterized protein n=1 Tax=Panagrolaimus sp. JU765 TaxID=591449 RepID=A0AC34QE27_9BILA